MDDVDVVQPLAAAAPAGRVTTHEVSPGGTVVTGDQFYSSEQRYLDALRVSISCSCTNLVAISSV